MISRRYCCALFVSSARWSDPAL